MYTVELKEAIFAAKKAGEVILEVYNSPETLKIDLKADRSPLTEADRASNRVIVPYLQKMFPKYAILSEEEKDDRERLNNDYCFVVDPLDANKCNDSSSPNNLFDKASGCLAKVIGDNWVIKD